MLSLGPDCLLTWASYALRYASNYYPLMLWGNEMKVRNAIRDLRSRGALLTSEQSLEPVSGSG